MRENDAKSSGYPMTPERILITGANGFVGRHLIQHLLQNNRPEVSEIAACVLATELADAEKWSKSVVVPAQEHLLNWHAVDLTLSGAAEQLIKETGPDSICHLAARASSADSDHEAVFKLNVEGSRMLLAAAGSATKPARVLLISTGYAYGSTSINRPAVETDPLAEPGIYGAYTDSKIAMEHVARDYGEIALIARSFSHTGPGQTPIFAVPSFARQLARIENGVDPPRISVGNLDALRDMLDVRDVVRAYALLLAHGKLGKTYNVASGKPHRMRDVLDQLRELSSVHTDVEQDLARLRPADIACSTGDSARLRELTGWTPAIPFEQTLQDTLNYWRRMVSS